jgi:putative transcriptional regulator
MKRRTIRELRRGAGLTQRELAIRIGISHMTVSHWESARNESSARQLQASAKLFSVLWNPSLLKEKRQLESGQPASGEMRKWHGAQSCGVCTVMARQPTQLA